MELVREIIVPNCKALSANNTYGLGRANKDGERHMFLTPEAIEVRKQIDEAIGFIHEVIDYPVYVEYEFMFKSRHRRDLDNCLKNTQDAITKSGLWLDDYLVYEIRAKKFIGCKMDAIQIKIYKIGE